LATVRAELDAQVMSLRRAESERDSLRSELERARERKSGEGRDLAVELGAVTKELERARAAAADRDELARTLDAERRRQSDAAALSDELVAVKRRHHDDKQLWQEQTRKDAEKLHREIAELKASVAKSARTQESLVKVQSELEAARAEVDKLRAAASSGTVAATAALAAKAEIEQLRGKLRVAEHAVEAGRSELSSLRSEVARLGEESSFAAGTRKDLAAVESQLQSMKVELAQAHKRVEELNREREEHRALREDNQRLRADLAQAAQLEEESKSLRQKVQAAQARGGEAEELRQQNRDLRDRLRDLERFEQAAREVDRIDAELRAAKLDNELLRRRLEDGEHDAASRSHLLEKLDDLTRRAAEAHVLRDRVQFLEARMFALDLQPEEPPRSAPRAEGSHEAALEEGPDALVRAGARTSALADSAGLLIAASGVTETHEGLAALSGLALAFVDRVGSLLPVSRVRWVQVVDDRDMNVFWSIFRSHGDEYSLSGMAPTVPDRAVLGEAVRRAQVAVDRAGGL
jgi:DNA repair exonuclease SbcCD ATPase subunit